MTTTSRNAPTLRRSAACVAAIVLGILASLLAATAATADDPVAAKASAHRATAKLGPVLAKDSLVTLGGATSYLKFPVMCRAEFSRSGSKIVVLRGTAGSACTGSNNQTALYVSTPKGTKLIKVVAGRVGAVAWSPDEKRLALKIAAKDFSEALYTMSASGGALTKILDYDDEDLSGQGGAISWSPTGKIAFIATNMTSLSVDGFAFADQVWTVPASGGHPTYYNTVFFDPTPGSCGGPGTTCDRVWYNSPQWSPDGSKLLVNYKEVHTDSSSNTSIVMSTGYLTPGAVKPVKLRQLSTRNDFLTDVNMQVTSRWSADGRTVLTTVLPTYSTAKVAVVNVASKAVTASKVTSIPFDWQRCPGGKCVAWPKAAKVTVSTSAVRLPKIKVSGKVAPTQSGTVTVRLSAKVNGVWKLTAIAAPLMSGGKYTTTFPTRPTAAQCKSTATFHGVTATALFHC